MHKFSIELFNNGDGQEFATFKRMEADNVLQFFQEVIKDIDISLKMREETFNIIQILPKKDFKTLKELKKFLATTAQQKLLEYTQYQKLKQQG